MKALITVDLMINNLPDNDLRRWIVVRLNKGEMWYYGTYDDYNRAEEVAKELVNGYVVEKFETVTEFADRCRECGAKYGKLLKQESMRDATPEERESVNAYIKRISKPTGIEFLDTMEQEFGKDWDKPQESEE